MTSTNVIKELNSLADKKQAKILQGFFKTGIGEYGEGDVFLGIKVPVQRKVAKKFKDLSLTEIEKLLKSEIHDHRMVALFILVEQFNKNLNDRERIIKLYLKNAAKYVNNWDLVDLSAPKILGEYLLNRPRDILYKFAKSKNLWEKRIAIVSTWTFIRHSDFKDTMKISEILLHDEHDLIHKAVGWMLREVGKKDQSILEKFLTKYSKKMPRTMLRYSIEKFDEKKRKFYMKK